VASIAEIMNEIEDRVKNANVINYSVWCIGVTSSPSECKKLHNQPPHFKSWDVNSPELAREIKNTYIENGMKEAFGGNGNSPDHVFIF